MNRDYFKNDIISRRKSLESIFDKTIGIYFLILRDQIVYIGQTKHLRNRLLVHHREKKIFTHYFFLPTKVKDLNKQELYYIRKFTPIYNKDGNLSFDSDLLEKFNIENRGLKLKLSIDKIDNTNIDQIDGVIILQIEKEMKTIDTLLTGNFIVRSDYLYVNIKKQVFKLLNTENPKFKVENTTQVYTVPKGKTFGKIIKM